MSWDEPEDHVRRYRLCQLGFGLIAVATAVMTADSAAHVAFLLSFQRDLFEFLNGGRWVWFAGTTIVWSSLIGSCLLLGRWSEGHWPRRARWLVGLALAGLALWVVRHGAAFGLFEGEAPWPLLRNHASFAFRLVWLVIVTGMAADVAQHLGRPEAAESRASLYAVLMAAATVWGLLLLYEWNGFGPRRFRPTPLYWLLYLGTAGLRALAAFFLTVLALLTARECGTILRELRASERGDDLFHDGPGPHG